MSSTIEAVKAAREAVKAAEKAKAEALAVISGMDVEKVIYELAENFLGEVITFSEFKTEILTLFSTEKKTSGGEIGKGKSLSDRMSLETGLGNFLNKAGEFLPYSGSYEGLLDKVCEKNGVQKSDTEACKNTLGFAPHSLRARIGDAAVRVQETAAKIGFVFLVENGVEKISVDVA